MQGTIMQTGRHSFASNNMAQSYSYCCIRDECGKVLIFMMNEQEGSTYSCQHCSQLGILSNWIHSLTLNYCLLAYVRECNDYVPYDGQT